MAKKGMLPVQAWDEINVSHARVQTPQRVEVVIKQPKEKKGRKSRKGKRNVD